MKRITTTTLKYTLFIGAVAAIAFAGGVLGANFANPGASSRDAVVAGDGTDRSLVQPAGPVSNGGSASATPVAYSDDDPSAVARSFQAQFRRVSSATLPVVVEINVVNRVTRRAQPNPFEFFFGRPDPNGGEEREYAMRGMGSGVIVGRDGDTVYVLTNNHVAGEADEIEVGLHDGRTFEADLVGGDELIDLAMLSFETDEDVPIAKLGDSDALQPGDWVFAVGNPLGFQSSITAGIVSATARAANAQSGMSGVTDYIQTDAAINRGNSGGALVNLDGEVVGINTWIASNSGGSIGLGFAIPVNNARRAIEDFIESGEVAYSWLGVQVSTLEEEYIDDFTGISAEDAGGISGAFVSAIYDDSPAARAGIRPGDLIVTVDGEEIEDSNDLVRTVASLEPGNTVPFRLVRNGTEMTINVRTGTRNDDAVANVAVWPGVSVSPLTDEIRERLELRRSVDGVLIAGVQRESRAAQSGIRRGDIVTAINGRSVDSVGDFYRILGEVESEEVQFRVVRDGSELILGFVRPVA